MPSKEKGSLGAFPSKPQRPRFCFVTDRLRFGPGGGSVSEIQSLTIAGRQGTVMSYLIGKGANRNLLFEQRARLRPASATQFIFAALWFE